MVESQISIDGDKVVDKDVLLIKYEGPSFENQMELHSFTRQIGSVERLLKEAVDQLNKNKKIKDNVDETQFYLQLRKGSFETLLLVLFSNPILINIASDCIFSFFKYLVTGIINPKYKKEIESLVNSKKIRNATRDIINPCTNNGDKAIIVNGDIYGNVNVNQLVIAKKEQEDIKNNLLKIEEEMPVEEYEKEMFGKILKVDAVKSEDHLSESKLGFVVEGSNQKPIETTFSTDISEEELKKILFERIRIKSIVQTKGEEVIKILINSYDLSPIKKLNSYMSDH